MRIIQLLIDCSTIQNLEDSDLTQKTFTHLVCHIAHKILNLQQEHGMDYGYKILYDSVAQCNTIFG